MKTAAVLVAALVVVAGVLVAVLTVGRATPEPAGGGRVAGLGDERGDLTAELDRLRTSVEALTARVERLELARPSPVAPVTAGGSARSPADTVTAADLEALRQELAALRAPAGNAPAVSAAFEQQVLCVIEAQERREGVAGHHPDGREGGAVRGPVRALPGELRERLRLRNRPRFGRRRG